MDFTCSEALSYSKSNRLAEWVNLFLTSSKFAANLDMAEQLRQRPTFWRGPILRSLSDLIRVCGPEATMAFVETPEKWNKNVDNLISLYESGLEFPPLIIKLRNGKHFIADGSHRHEALIRKEVKEYWTIWYSHEEKEFDLFKYDGGV